MYIVSNKAIDSRSEDSVNFTYRYQKFNHKSLLDMLIVKYFGGDCVNVSIVIVNYHVFVE